MEPRGLVTHGMEAGCPRAFFCHRFRLGLLPHDGISDLTLHAWEAQIYSFYWDYFGSCCTSFEVFGHFRGFCPIWPSCFISYLWSHLLASCQFQLVLALTRSFWRIYIMWPHYMSVSYITTCHDYVDHFSYWRGFFWLVRISNWCHLRPLECHATANV